MNTSFRMFNAYNRLIFFDCEMARGRKDITKYPEEFSAWKYLKRDKETEQELSNEEAIKLYNKSAALNPIFGKLVSLTIGVIVSGQYIKLKTFTGEEADIIDGFYKVIGGNAPQYSLVSFNGIEFDLPWLEKKSLMLGIKVPDRFCSYGKKPWDWDGLHYDLMKMFKGNSFYNDSLANICLGMSLESPKKELNGSEVSDLYWQNPKKNLSEIVSYGEKDVTSIINVFLKLQYKEPLKEIKK